MSGNIFGKLFSLSTAGESHGQGYIAIVDGCPPAMELSEADIQIELDRRKPGQSRHVSPRKEDDTVHIISGVFEAKTTGTPIGLLINNEDQKTRDYSNIKNLFRPGHADYSYQQKYGIRDYRGGGRSSARETCMRVAAGAIAKKYLNQQYGVCIRAYLSQLGEHELPLDDWDAVNLNPFFTAAADKVEQLERYMDELRKSGDSIGARINLVAESVPVGWGDPVFDRLDADIAKAMMSINAVKGVEIGDGFDVVHQTGSKHRDEMTPHGFLSNHSGGILGGISTGQNIHVSIAVKPTSSIRLAGKTIDHTGNATEISTKGRHDPCVGIRAVPIAEAMMALVLMDHALRHRAQNQNVQSTVPVIPCGTD